MEQKDMPHMDKYKEHYKWLDL